MHLLIALVIKSTAFAGAPAAAAALFRVGVLGKQAVFGFTVICQFTVQQT